MRSQSATEYLIVLAVVLVIGVIVVGVLGGIPGIGSGKSDDISEFELSIEEVGMSSYASTSSQTTFILKNNYDEKVTVDEVWVNQKTCATTPSALPKTLKVGEEFTLICYNIQSLVETPRLNIQWSDATASDFITFETQNYKDVSDQSCWSDSPNSNGYFELCTCHDLNRTKTNLSRDYALQNNIDFTHGNCTVYREGSGWLPIGNYSPDPYTGDFFGYNNVVDNLFSDRSSRERNGLFGYLTGSVSNLHITNAYVSGDDAVGIAAGYVAGGSLDNIFVSGEVVGGDTGIGGVAGELQSSSTVIDSVAVADITGAVATGGLVGAAYASTVNTSFAIGTTSVTSFIGGGVVGYLESDAYIENSYSNVAVSGGNIVGGIIGNGFGIIENSYALGTVSGSSPGGVTGESAGNFSNVTWVNHTSDDAVSCTSSGTETGCTP